MPLQDIAGRYDGAEASKSIWVSVDPRGRVLSVDISSTWRKRLEPDGFADALFAAYSAAMDERLAGLASLRVTPPDIREVRGSAGYVTLRLRGSVVVGMTANVAALRSANPNMVRQDVLDAFEAAQY